ncbi:MAG: hypothetical protein NTW87_03345 [Planctomycetota bacterium]|nr:hypothetical protein [Planctomycetota bacterium]
MSDVLSTLLQMAGVFVATLFLCDLYNRSLGRRVLPGRKGIPTGAIALLGVGALIGAALILYAVQITHKMGELGGAVKELRFALYLALAFFCGVFVLASVFWVWAIRNADRTCYCYLVPRHLVVEAICSVMQRHGFECAAKKGIGRTIVATGQGRAVVTHLLGGCRIVVDRRLHDARAGLLGEVVEALRAERPE